MNETSMLLRKKEEQQDVEEKERERDERRKEGSQREQNTLLAFGMSQVQIPGPGNLTELFVGFLSK
mgnify:CR=1 FL=1